MKRLIVNADDFGLHAAVNRGIAAGHSGGIITSASLMASGEAFDDAVGIAGKYPLLGVGVHLALVGGGKPVLPPKSIPSLLNEQGLFFSGHPDFLKRYFAGRINLLEVELELTAQVEKVCAAGISPSHFDSHQHLHALPGIFAIVGKLAEQFNVHAIRRPAEPVLYFGGSRTSAGRIAGRTGLSLLSAWTMRKAMMGGLTATDHFYGMLSGGRMNETELQELIAALPEGSTEIMTHPGLDGEVLSRDYNWGYHWEEELQALTSPILRELINNRAIRLISFREL